MKFKCTRCKEQKVFRVEETVKSTYYSDCDDDFGVEENMESLKTEVYCNKCGRKITYKPE